jgi:hypothetical protein
MGKALYFSNGNQQAMVPPRSIPFALSIALMLSGSAHAGQSTRTFMAPDGQESSTSTTGNTLVYMTPGSTQQISVWIEDTGSGQALNNYQMIIKWFGAAQGGATGSVNYVDDGALGGLSVLIDEARTDWVFANLGANPPFYNENEALDGFGAIGTRLQLSDGDPVNGLKYLGEFELESSPDACGQFELAWVPINEPPNGGTSLGQAGGLTPFAIGEFQNLTIDFTPPNDDCMNAAPIFDGSTDITTLCASTDGSAHTECDVNGNDQIHRDLWFEYTASCSGEVIISTCNTVDFDSRIAVYSGGAACPPGDAGLLVCNDDGMGCGGFTSQVTLTVELGDTYLIRLGGHDDMAVGAGTLNITCLGGDCLFDNQADIDNYCGPAPTCMRNVCNKFDMCDHIVATAGTLCDDSDICTLVDTCDNNGNCVGSSTNPCNDFDPCTIDSCDLANGGDGCANASVSGDVCVIDDDCIPAGAGSAVIAACDGGFCTCQVLSGELNSLCLKLRNATGPSLGNCITDADCGPAPDGVLHCIDDNTNPLDGGMCLDQACYASDELITIDLELGATSAPSCGAQLFMGWDPATLQVVDVVVDPDGELGWGQVFFNGQSEGPGTWDIVLATPIGLACNAANGVLSGGTIARLTVNPLVECKNAGVYFREHNPVTGIGGASGPMPIHGCASDPEPSPTQPMQVQDAPVWSCPEDDVGNANCGGLTRDVTIGVPSVTDDCDDITATIEELCTVTRFVPCQGDLDCGYNRSDLCATDAECGGGAGDCVADSAVDGFVCDGNLPCVGFCRTDICTNGYCASSGTRSDDTAAILAGGDLTLPPSRYFVECSYTNSCGRTGSCNYEILNSGLNTAIIDVELSPTMVHGTAENPISRCIEFGLNICGGSGDPLNFYSDVIFGAPGQIAGHGTAMLAISAGNWDCLTARDPAHSLMSSCVIECTPDDHLYAEFKGSKDLLDTCHWLVQGNLNGGPNIDVVDYGLAAAELHTLAPDGNDSPCNQTDIDADFNGDGLITLADLAFIIDNFFCESKDPCDTFCNPDGGGGGGDVRSDGPRSAITVTEMDALGFGDAAIIADVNGDGVIDFDDMSLTISDSADIEPDVADDLQDKIRKLKRSHRSRKKSRRAK